jgi:hypothetical protein
MTIQSNQATQFDPVITAAAQLLTQRIGVPVQLTDVVCLSEEERRNRLLRVRVENPPAGLPTSLIIKQVVAKEYNPEQIDSWDTQRFFRDWAGAEFLSNLPGDPGHGPRFYGGNRELGFIILEDLGQNHHSLVEPLLEGDAASAEAALLRYITRLGKMHADTIGKAAEFQALLQAANPALVRAPVVHAERSPGIPHFTEILTSFGVAVEADLLTELQAMYARIEQPGAFSAFIHQDLCPDNLFFIGQDVRLFDFEGGSFGHALIDASYVRIPFPTCWCCNRIPQPVVVKLEAAYRAELMRGCPAAADDRLFAQALGDACGYSLLEWLRWWETPSTPLEDYRWGLASIRSRILVRLETLINTASEFDLLPHLRASASQLLTTLQTHWPDAEAMPLYPAFR